MWCGLASPLLRPFQQKRTMESVGTIPTVSPQALDSASSAGVSLNSINLRHVTEPRKTPSPPVSLRAKTFLIPCMSTRLIPQSALHKSSVQRRARNANRPTSRRRWKTLQTNKGEPREGKTEREVDAGDQEAEDDEKGIEWKKKERFHFLHKRIVPQVRQTCAEEQTIR